MAHVSIELELAEKFGHGKLWQGGVFASHRAITVESSNLDTALAAIKAAVTELTAPPAKKPKPIEAMPPAPPPVARPDDGQAMPRKPRGQRRTTPEPFFPADAGGSTGALR